MHELGELWDGATFMPHDDPTRTERLLEKVWRSRQAKFVAFGLKVMVKAPELYRVTRFADSLAAFERLPDETRRRVVEHPLFMIWLRQSVLALASGVGADLRHSLADVSRVLSVSEAREDGTPAIKRDGRQVEVRRFDLDPLIVRAASPEYRVPDQRRLQEFEARVVYPEGFFIEMLSVALARIERSWPAAHRDFFRFVRIVVDMIDGDSTSLSACHHTGVIFEQGKYFGISGVGTRAWALLEQPTTIDTLCTLVVAEFDVDPATCRRDMLAFADKLLVLGLLSVHNPPHPP